MVWFWGFSVDCLLTLLFVVWRWWFDLDGVGVVWFVLVVGLVVGLIGLVCWLVLRV